MAHRSTASLRRARRLALLALPAVTAGLAVMPVAHASTRPSSAPGWRIVKTFATKNIELQDVAGFSDRTAWASGQRPSQTPVVYHLRGGTWTATSLPGGAGTFAPVLSATSPANVWALLVNEPLIARLTAKGWVTTSFASGTDQVAPGGLITTGPKNTWAFTFDFTTSIAQAHHYNGSSWTATTLPALVDGAGLTGLVSGSGPGNIWAWAFNRTLGTTTTLHYDGQHWTTVAIPAHLVPSTQFLDAKQILALSPVNVWATANNGRTAGSIILLHWQGHGWRRVTRNLPNGEELAGPIASDGHGGLWLEAYGRSGAYFIQHYSGGKWTRYDMPSSRFGPVQLFSLHLIPGTSSVIGAGFLNFTDAGTNGSVIVKYGP